MKIYTIVGGSYMSLDKLLKYFCFIIVAVLTIVNIGEGYINRSYDKIFIETNSNAYGKIIANDMRALFDFKKSEVNLLDYVAFLYKIDEKIEIVEHTMSKVRIKRNYIYNEDYKKFTISCIFLIEEFKAEVEECGYNNELIELVVMKISQNVSDRSQNDLNQLLEINYINTLNNNLIRSVHENYLNSKISEAFLEIYLGVEGFMIRSKRADIALDIVDFNPKIEGVVYYTTIGSKKVGKHVYEKTIGYKYKGYVCESVINNQIFMLMNSFGVDIADKYNSQLIEWSKFPKLEYTSRCSKVI